MRLRACASVLVCVGLILASQAARAEVPCAADIQKLCKDVPAGGGRIQACLKENEAKVSETCRKKIDDLASEVKTLAVVCRWDIGRLCSDETPGSGRLLPCLERSESQLSPECLSQLKSMKK